MVPLFLVGALTIASQIGGCGDEDVKILFEDCGNGVIDNSEQCDDGNTSDEDACLSTCVPAACGDGFRNAGVEDCDGANLGGQTCAGLGLGNGALACTASCDFNTTGCGGGPVPTETFGQPTPGPTPTDGSGVTPTGAGTPVPTPTGGGQACTGTVSLTITVTYDEVSFNDVSGIVAMVDYPSAAVLIPGLGNAQSVQDRVTDVTGVQGNLLNVADSDNEPGSHVNVGIVNITTPLPSGPFARVQYDCRAGANVPSTSDFGCALDISTNSGTPVTGAVCNVAVQTP